METVEDINNNDNNNKKKKYGVLLYYKYAAVPDLESLLSFYTSNCNSLSLLGRVRLSSNGVNVTVGGELMALEKHITAVKSMDLFQGTDFKLASCDSPLNDKVARECGFTSLSIRIVKELVTFSSYPLLKEPNVLDAGRHLSAVEFHSVLHNAGTGGANDAKGILLLDARNLYETRIGKFHIPAVETLDPGIRLYSDLPSWIDDNTQQLHGKNVLMYCTGGIRCEMASAYIRSKGDGFENVFQLFGGIQRYLEQFPDGGFFRGKNFVFDHRISVGSSDPSILGACLRCGVPFDNYSSRCRCFYCRMLVLVCDSCQLEEASYVCELCQKHGKAVELVTSTENGEPQQTKLQIDLDNALSNSSHPPHPQGIGIRPTRKLRILCLHGFRQNASGFKGRTASLAKKLKSMAELVFIDAPHELHFIYQPHIPTEDCRDKKIVPPAENCKPKFAWLISPDFAETIGTEWKAANGPFDPLQYEKQTEGLDVSLSYLDTIFSEKGPFDGILGFSQGAAMAALVCARKGALDFRFSILCSGFAVKAADMAARSINIPSLHIFGSISGKDRQIINEASRDLASLFDDGSSAIIEHDSGHIIPTRAPYIDQIKGFLQRFL